MQFNVSSGLVIVVISIITMGCVVSCSDDTSNRHSQVVTISIGSTADVAGGKSKIWVGMVGTDYRDDLDADVESVRFELVCDGRRYGSIAFADRFTNETCGVQVRLVEVIHTTPPSAKLEVTWHAATAEAQSARQ